MTELDETPAPRILSALTRSTQAFFLNHFDAVFVFIILFSLGFILVFIDQKLSFLNFFFIPVLLAGYFMSTRSAVLGGLLAVAWVTFSVVVNPDSFYQELDRMSLYLHLVSWGSFLLLTGALVGKMNEELRARFFKARETLGRLNQLQEKLSDTNKRLEAKNLDLELTKARVEAVLYSTMDPNVAKLIIDRKLKSENRALSVLFADLADFTAYAEERMPESVIEDLNRLFSFMEPTLLQYRGHLDKYLGDGFMAEFGVPYPAANHALLATLAALRILSRMEARDFPWKMRVGIASGPALVGLMGSESRKNYTAIGDMVNLASRLHELAPPGGLVVDENVYAQIRRWFHVRRIRSGLSEEEAKNMEARLELLNQAIAHAPTSKLCHEAAELCSELGDPARAMSLHRKALELDPARRDPVEQAIAAAMLTGEERGFVAVKGKKRRVAAYWVLGLKDPLDDVLRLPPKVAGVFRELAGRVNLPAEVLLPIEGLEGSIGHAPATAALAAALAQALGLEERQKRNTFLAAYLHDIGKRNIPERLLGCEDRLEELPLPDQESFKAHVAEASKVMEDLGIPSNPEIAEAIAQHHERFDGGGYPKGLKGEQIGLSARVIAVADAYESLTGGRLAGEPLAKAGALAQLRREISEGKFDPRVGEVFLKMMET